MSFICLLLIQLCRLFTVSVVVVVAVVLLLLFFVFVFFFQAEDGIRDVAVTGVQTCALPIWSEKNIPREKCNKSKREFIEYCEPPTTPRTCSSTVR